jgi:hypothetical protein
VKLDFAVSPDDAEGLRRGLAVVEDLANHV